MSGFWDFFESVESRLQHRAPTFRQMFEHVDRFESPVTIVETGCARQAGNWIGDGCSTVLFDQYVTARNDGSKVKTVDLSARAVEVCRTLVSDRVDVVQDDSVPFLHNFVKEAKLLRLNCDKAHTLLNWKPILNLDQCISMTIDWYKKSNLGIDETKEISKSHVKWFIENF